MIPAEISRDFLYSLDAALAHPDAPGRNEFLASEWPFIYQYFQDRWKILFYLPEDPYLRTLIATFPPGDNEPRFYYSVRGRLRPDGIIEIENITIDWDYSPGS